MLDILTRSKIHGRGSRPKAKPAIGFRPDIQGLRALAVLLVIGDHLFSWPTGGFVGVDVFFVLSGFLITGLLIREHEKRGRISFANFYRRRARRILPLAILVIVTTIAGAWALFNNVRALKVAEEGLWSLAFGANWHFAAVGTDYMQADGVVSPFQHFWSLAVEEQFYVVWPWVIILILGGLAARLQWSGAQARRALIVFIAVFAVGSFAYALWETTAAPTVAYFSTFSRAWELALGALLAALAPVFGAIPDRIRPAIASVGLVGIAAGAFFVTSTSAFPAPWAALPVLATALVIIAGTGTSRPSMTLLSNSVSRYIGDISYSLYLWHFPVIILLGTLFPLASFRSYLAILGVVFGLSALSHYFLEQPIIKSQWLEPKSARKAANRGDPRRLTHGAIIALALVTAVTVSAALMRTPAAADYVTAPTPVSAPKVSNAEEVAAPAATELASQISAALTAPAWPTLIPALDDLGPQAKAPEWVDDNCLMGDYGTIKDLERYSAPCVYGDPGASKTAVILGDSTAISYAPTVRAALEPQGYKIFVYALQQCPAVNVAVLNSDKTPHAECDEFRNWAFNKIQDLRPDMVLMSSLHSAALQSGATGNDFQAEWKAGAEDTYRRVASEVTQIIVLGSPPIGKELSTCLTRNSTPSNCATDIQQNFRDVVEANQAAAKAVVATAKVEVLDTKSWFCVATKCPAFVGTTPVYADGYHLTSAYAVSLGPVLAEALTLGQ